MSVVSDIPVGVSQADDFYYCLLFIDEPVTGRNVIKTVTQW